jgi:hypothetical protein
MKKVSTTATMQSRKVSVQQKLTIGLDLGDRNSWYCVFSGGCCPHWACSFPNNVEVSDGFREEVKRGEGDNCRQALLPKTRSQQ